MMRRYTLEVGGTSYTIVVEEVAADRFKVTLGDDEAYDVRLASDEDMSQTSSTPEIVPARASPLTYHSRIADTSRDVPAERLYSAPGAADLLAPMPGLIVSVAVKPGEAVTRGQVLLMMETMKMQNPLRSARDGVVAELYVQAGQNVAYGDVLVRFAES